MATNTLINHADVADQLETVAQIVGVERGEDMYKKVSAERDEAPLAQSAGVPREVLSTPFL